MSNIPVSAEVSTDVGGKIYTARFTVASKVVTVHMVYGTKSTQIGASSGRDVAKRLLAQIIREAKAQGELD